VRGAKTDGSTVSSDLVSVYDDVNLYFTAIRSVQQVKSPS
jgi:hypothetical protein